MGEHGGRPKLRVAAAFHIPLREVSGLALRGSEGAVELLAVGDATAELARAPLAGGVPGAWRVDRVEGVKDKKGSQLEAVAVEPDGRILLLRESPPAIFRLDESATAVDRELARDLSGDPTWAEVPRDDPNSMGEGLVLAADGEVVLAKEKRPSALLHGALAQPVPPGAAPLLTVAVRSGAAGGARRRG